MNTTRTLTLPADRSNTLARFLNTPGVETYFRVLCRPPEHGQAWARIMCVVTIGEIERSLSYEKSSRTSRHADAMGEADTQYLAVLDVSEELEEAKAGRLNEESMLFCALESLMRQFEEGAVPATPAEIARTGAMH